VAVDRNKPKRSLLPVLFIAPAFVLVIALTIIPLLSSLALSFVHWDFGNRMAPVRWAGLDHWARLFTDRHFHYVLLNTLLYFAIGIPIQFFIGLGLARSLDRARRQQNWLRILFLMPMMLSPVVVAFIVGRVMFNETVGPINAGLSAAGLPAVPWLTSSVGAFVAVLLVDTWQWVPFFMLVLLAGLSAVSNEVEDAARLDTTSDSQAFWRVTFPMLVPWSVTAILIRSIEMLKIADVIVVLTNGGPGIATESLTLYAYRVGIVNFDLGYAATLAFSLLIVATIIATFILAASRRMVERLL
jgi:multiple sugar transport system permease protein